VGLVARPGEGTPLRPLVRALASRATVRAIRDDAATPDAVLATSPGALAGAPSWNGPPAVWIGDREHLEAFRDLPASVPHTVITPLAAAAEAARAGGAQVLEVSAGLGESEVQPWQPPLLRQRWREREGLPERFVLVVVGGTEGGVTGSDTDEEEVDGVAVRRVSADDPALTHLLSRASAAVVPLPADLARSLPTGCPTVTSAAAAAGAGVDDGVHVVVAGDDGTDTDTGAAVAAAIGLALDPLLASRLSRAAATYAAQASVGRAATRLMALLHLHAAPTDPWHRSLARLEEIDLPAGGPFRRRMLDALSLFEPAGGNTP
jgi:hypothetical protein